MVFLKNKQNPRGTGVRGFVQELGFETLKSFKETGKEVLKGVTMLPHDLIVGALGGEISTSGEGKKDKSWADEWLNNPDKANAAKIAEKEGGHSQINPAEMMGKHDKAKEQAILRQLQGSLHGTYTRASSTSEYGQQKAQEQQQAQMSVYDKIQQEQEQRRKQQANQAQQGSGVAMPTAKPKGKLGQKKQKAAMTIENKANRGKQ